MVKFGIEEASIEVVKAQIALPLLNPLYISTKLIQLNVEFYMLSRMNG